MSYTVRYGEDVPEQVPVKAGRFGLAGALTVPIVLAAVLGMAMPDQLDGLREVLFPWTQEAVREAFGSFQQELRQGQSFREAFGDFCVEIIEDAQDPV